VLSAVRLLAGEISGSDLSSRIVMAPGLFCTILNPNRCRLCKTQFDAAGLDRTLDQLAGYLAKA
jgi:hypothetical protein